MPLPSQDPTPRGSGTLTELVAEFVCSDWRGPRTTPAYGAYTSQVAAKFGTTRAQARAALNRAEKRGLIAAFRCPPGYETYWTKP